MKPKKANLICVAIVTGISFYKSCQLSSSIFGDSFSHFLHFASPDIITLSSLSILVVIQSSLASRKPRMLSGLLIITLSLIYILDSILLLGLNSRFSIDDFLRFLPEFREGIRFFGYWSFFIVIFLLAGLFIQVTINPKLKLTLLFASFSLPLVPVTFNTGLPRIYSLYKTNIFYKLLFSEEALAESEEIKRVDSNYYREIAKKLDQISIPKSKPNIILVILESLSSGDSLKISGLRNNLTLFDQLSSEGTLFTNFYANHGASEGGIVALLSGVPPLYVPGGKYSPYLDYSQGPSIVRHFKQHNYHTEFLTTGTTQFLKKGVYLKGVGFARFRGYYETRYFVKNKFWHDNHLYEESIRVINHIKSLAPYFFVIATSTTHKPYIHPELKVRDHKLTWAWSLEKLINFYHALDRVNFFKNGILIVVGDHRGMHPFREEEVQRYGESLRARVPLLLLGTGIKRDVIDQRVFQQSDLFRKLDEAINTNNPLTLNPIFVERYTERQAPISNSRKLLVFDQNGKDTEAYSFYFADGNVRWLERKPLFHARVEEQLFAQQSILNISVKPEH